MTDNQILTQDEEAAGDEQLVRSVLSGRTSAFDVLMRRHTQAIRILISRYFRCRSQVDDLAQETFAKAYFHLTEYRGKSPFRFWLRKIAVRICLDEIRRSGRYSKRFLPFEETEEGRMTIEFPSMNQGEEQMEMQLLVEEILKSLSPIDRMILVLTEGEGYRLSEVAQLTGLSQVNVKVRSMRLRKKIQIMLQKADGKLDGKTE